MKKCLVKSLMIVLALLLCACTNPYAKFYKDMTGGLALANNPNIESANTPPRLIPTGNHDATAMQLREEGYLILGYSSFWAGDFSESRAIDHAEKINASVILFSKKYRNSQSGSVPLTLPNTQTSYNSFSGNIYGSGGNANYYGTGSTTTYGTQTTYIPYTNHYYDYMVSYWVKQKEFRLGIEPKELSDSSKIAIGSNKGVEVSLVIKNTSAYEEDILKGDVLRKIFNDDIQDVESFYRLLDKYEGSTVKITLVRNGQEMTKEVKINKTKQ